MASTYSSHLRLTKQADGENVGTWGGIVNEQFLQLIEDAVATTANITATGGTYTLTTGFGQPDQARCAVLNFSSTLNSNLDAIIPSVSKIYLVLNNTVGNYTLSIGTSSGNQLNITQGDKAWVYSDGTNTYMVSDANGGGGSSTLAGTATGAINMNNFAFTNAPIATSTFTGGSVIKSTIKSYNEFETNGGSVTGALSLDYNNGCVQNFTLTGNCTVSTANWPTTSSGSMTVMLKQDASGSRALTLPSSFKAAGGSPISLSTAAGSIDIMYITSPDGATFYYTIVKAFA